MCCVVSVASFLYPLASGQCCSRSVPLHVPFLDPYLAHFLSLVHLFLLLLLLLFLSSHPSSPLPALDTPHYFFRVFHPCPRLTLTPSPSPFRHPGPFFVSYCFTPTLPPFTLFFLSHFLSLSLSEFPRSLFSFNLPLPVEDSLSLGSFSLFRRLLSHISFTRACQLQSSFWSLQFHFPIYLSFDLPSDRVSAVALMSVLRLTVVLWPLKKGEGVHALLIVGAAEVRCTSSARQRTHSSFSPSPRGKYAYGLNSQAWELLPCPSPVGFSIDGCSSCPDVEVTIHSTAW